MAKNPTEDLTQQYGNLVPTGRLRDGRPRSILFDATKCIGCRHCVQACKDWNEHDRTSLYELSSTNWITMEPPVRPYARSKQSPNTKKDRLRSIRRRASDANTASTLVLGKSSPRTTSPGK